MRNRNFPFIMAWLMLCLACAGESSAQQKVAPKRPEPPSWLRPPHRKALPPKPPVRIAYKPRGYANALTVNPAVLVYDYFGAVGVGAEYERFLNKSGHFSIALSGYAFMPLGYPKLDEEGGTVMRSGFTILPAVLFHPGGNARFADYSFGLAPGLFILSTDVHDHAFSTNVVDKSAVVLAQANLVVHHTSRFVFGFHISGGLLLNNERSGRGVLQFGFKLGRRF